MTIAEPVSLDRTEPALSGRLTRYGISVGLVGLVAAGLICYPLSPWVLATALVLYSGVLWRWPVAFLLVLPCVLPAWDCGLWTGWMMVGEADFFILMTIAVLLIRTPLSMIDVMPSGLARTVVLSLIAAWTIATVTGMCSTLGAAQSDNAFLRPDNALRLAKGLAEAVLLLPFLRQCQRSGHDGVLWFGWGMTAGLGFVSLSVFAERSLFPGILDVSGAYRVAGPFSSMRVGGGHIGAYLVLALPMTVCLVCCRPRWLGWIALLAIWVSGGYSLIVTFARTGYAAGGIAMIVAGAGCALATRPRNRDMIRWVGLALVIPVVFSFVAATTGMSTRVADTARDLLTRQDNWRAGLAVRDPGLLSTLFGMGLGTYQRAMLSRSLVNRPTDVVVSHDKAGAYITMRVESPFFLGQKITLPTDGDLRLSLQARSPDDRTTIGILLCDKVLLYSDNCRGDGFVLSEPNVWQPIVVALPVGGLGGGAWLAMLNRPVEMSLFGGPTSHSVDLRDVRLTGPQGQDAITNGDFRHGLDRWIFTDDSHVSWRMLNQYLMLWFETGIFGLSTFLALAGLALFGGYRAVRDGAVAGAGVAGAVIGLLICGLFDNVLEAPRVATLFFLACLSGVLQWEVRRY